MQCLRIKSPDIFIENIQEMHITTHGNISINMYRGTGFEINRVGLVFKKGSKLWISIQLRYSNGGVKIHDKNNMVEHEIYKYNNWDRDFISDLFKKLRWETC